MSIYGTWLSIEHPERWMADLRAQGISAGVIGDDTEGRALGSPWVYQGSHILPQPGDRRGGSVDVAAIPSFIERTDQDGGAEGEMKDWLRLSVDSENSDEMYEGKPYVQGGHAVVVLDRAQVEALHRTLTAWLEREPEDDS